jgi:hypothetical protein
MLMTTSNRVERVCGLLTGVFAIIAALQIVNVNFPIQILASLLLSILPALLVVVGSWIHSGTQKKSGFLILLVGGLVLVLELVPGFLGTFYFHGLLVGLLTLTPGVMAAMTIVAAWVSKTK